MSLTAFESAFVLHFVGDWLLQNHWIAANKTNLGHPASWVHGAIHALLLGVALGWVGGLVLGVAHVIVDTRQILRWWIGNLKKSERSPDLPIILVGCDQVLHIGCIAAWIAIAGQW